MLRFNLITIEYHRKGQDMEAPIISFSEATRATEHMTRHLLLGNGFSIACFPKTFAYTSLFEQANFERDDTDSSSAKRLRSLFDELNTRDFEDVIKMLENTSRILALYPALDADKQTVAKQMADDAVDLREILIDTIANNHPHRPAEIRASQFKACRKFLSYFLDRNMDGNVYTLNYDILLYWTLMHRKNESKECFVLETGDGFSKGRNGSLIWKEESTTIRQRIYYLHGALHFFNVGAELSKHTYSKQKPIMRQVRKATKDGHFPLFVAEGESPKKLDKIRHSDYLHSSYENFSRRMDGQEGALFIYGHRLAENDGHILRKIAFGKIPQLYISIYGDPESEENRIIRESAYELESRRSRLRKWRKTTPPLSVTFFDADSANVWG